MTSDGCLAIAPFIIPKLTQKHPGTRFVRLPAQFFQGGRIPTLGQPAGVNHFITGTFRQGMGPSLEELFSQLTT